MYEAGLFYQEAAASSNKEEPKSSGKLFQATVDRRIH
jgi:hypothetical protein